MSTSASPTPPPPQAKTKQTSTIFSGCSLILVLLHCLRKRKRTAPSSDSDSNLPHPFSYDLLRRATNSFSTLLGHGSFGPVFSGSLSSAGKPVAVKLMDSASVGNQGEREFHNELFFASKLRSNLLVPAIGFSSDPKRRRYLLVYELMHNGNLHDALLRRKCPNLMLWNTRFSIVLDIAKGIQYLHSCDPPIIHGDIKPSNILLDHSFSAKIADFGLARVKTVELEIEVEIETDHRRKEEFESDGGETESVNTGFDSETNIVKDYVMDWFGKEVKEEMPKVDCAGSGNGKIERKKSKKELEWWKSMDGDGVLKKEKRRPAREWWKEEYSQELEKKNKMKKKQESKKGVSKSNNDWCDYERDDALYSNVKSSNKNRSRKERSSRGSNDSWLSGEIPKSGAISSTPSMRGTVFYVAPENGYSGENVSEKCDVYSFGVLLLVIVSGRRPLQVSESPMSEFKRANLVSWARHCARNGKLLELVDESVLSLDKEQALLCIKIALLCLLKSPVRRPSMKEVVGMLSRELEYSQSRFPFNKSDA